MKRLTIMQQILLFNPSVDNVYKGFKGPSFPPVGLVTLATVLKEASFPVKIIDQNLTHLTDEYLRKRLEDCSLAGISITTPTMTPGLKLAERIKSLVPNTKVVMGGVHVTLRPDDVMSSPAVDYAIEGEGELPLTYLAESLLKEGREPDEFPGLWRRDRSGRPIKSADREYLKDLDDLPTPDFTTLEKLRYNYPDALFSPVLPIITSRGCPGRCTFCNALFLWGRKLRMRSAEKVVQDFKNLYEKHRVKEIHIWDDNFISNRERVREIARLIGEEGLKFRFAFPNGVRLDFIDEEIVTLLKKMGTYSLAVGVESGSQRILDQMKKNITLEKIEERFRILKSFKFEIWAFFLLGMPDETAETIQETIDFAIKLDPDVAKFHILKPYPETEVTQELFDKGFILNSNYEEYGIHLAPVHRTNALSPVELMHWQQTAYKRFFLRPRKIASETLRMVRSCHRIYSNAPLAARFLISNVFGIM